MRLIVLIFSLLLLAACSKGHDPESPADPVEPTEIRGVWPIVKGNHWAYKDSGYNKGVFYYTMDDTLYTKESTFVDGHFYYGTFLSLPQFFLSQTDDYTVKLFNGYNLANYIFFKQVATNDSLISKKELDAMIPVNGTERNVHIITTLRGYTELTKVNGYDCIRNEFVTTYDGEVYSKDIIYVKPGIGMVRSVEYERIDVTGPLVITYSRDLVSYKFR
ncbi:MAG: hypothetical protein ABI675_28590 [Chitinophagaceae bacterium]